MAITYYLQSKKNPAPIYIRLRMGDIDAKANTNFLVNHENFNKGKIIYEKLPKGTQLASVKSEVQSKNTALIKLDSQLDNLRTKVAERYNTKNKIEKINSEWLKSVVNPSVQKSNIPNLLLEYFDFFIDFKRNSLKKGTLRQLKVYQTRVKKFQNENGKVYIDDVNKKFSLLMQKWCDDNLYDHNTKVKTIKVIRTVCSHAKEFGVETHPEMEDIAKGLKYKKGVIIYLDFEEIKAIKETEILDEQLIVARDWLIVSCFTAQRISDFLKFISSDLVVLEGEKFIDIRQEKTEAPIYIPVHDEVLRILEKRNGEFPPPFSESVASNENYYNRLVKIVCKRAGITNIVTAKVKNKKTNRYELVEVPKYKAISGHVGRRSFASNYYGLLDNSLIRVFTGHKSDRELRNYVGKKEIQSAVLASKAIKKIEW